MPRSRCLYSAGTTGSACVLPLVVVLEQPEPRVVSKNPKFEGKQQCKLVRRTQDHCLAIVRALMISTDLDYDRSAPSMELR